LNGKEVTHFAKDGRIMTLEELGIDRITRRKIIEEYYRGDVLSGEEEGKFYGNNLEAKEIEKNFNERFPDLNMDLASHGVSKEGVSLIAKEYDKLLQTHFIDGKTLKTIRVATREEELEGLIGRYYKNEIVFSRKYLNNPIDFMKEEFRNGRSSTDNPNHIALHKFAHAYDRFIQLRTGRLGNRLLIEKLKNKNYYWDNMARSISKNALYDEGGFFAELFPKYYNNALLSGNTAIDRPFEIIIAFFSDLGI